MKNTLANKKILIPVILLLIAASIGVYYFFFRTTDHAVTATGMIEITQADLTPKVSGYLVERKFKEGDSVSQGEIIAVIDKTDYALKYQESVASYQSAQSKLNDLLAGSRSAEIFSYRAAMTSAQNSRDKAASDYQRYEKLYEGGGISAQSLDNYRVALTTSEGNLEQAQAAYQLALEGNRTDAIQAQRHVVEQTEAAMQSAQRILQDTDVKSPLTGKVLSKNYEVGEFVSAGSPIATIGDLHDCWVKIYVPSTMLGQVTLGQEAEVKIDSYPNRTFKGTVKEIATEAEFTPRQTITKDERANLVFAVKVYLENPDGIFKPGMPAEVRIP